MLLLSLHAPPPVDEPHDGGDGGPDEAREGKSQSKAVVRKIVISKTWLPSEAHSLVAVRIIPVVKIILELKFIFLPQNRLQEQP